MGMSFPSWSDIGLGPKAPYTSDRQKAKHSMSYISFLRLVQYLWNQGHPDVPLNATGGEEEAQYPSIVYRGDYAKAFDGEPKPKLREIITTPEDQPAIYIFGQRFDHIITFTVYTVLNPHLAEEIRETFEDFMIEMTPVFKELGVSDFFYARRNPDQEGERPGGQTRTERGVSYRVVVEKLIQVEAAKLNQVIIDARAFLEKPSAYSFATPNYADATPIQIDIVDTFNP